MTTRRLARRARHIAFDRDLGERLCLLREAFGLSEREVAADLGVTLRTYRRYEDGRGAGNIPGFLLLALADKHNISTGWFGGEEPE